MTQNLVPCSDVAGEVVAVGKDVKEWKQGDRVCANFLQTYIDGDLTDEGLRSMLGGLLPGVLVEYRTFPANVCPLHSHINLKSDQVQSLVRIPEYLNFEEASTLP